MKLLPADIVLTHSPNLLSRGLLWGQRDPGEAPSRAGHVALVSKPALWSGGSLNTISWGGGGRAIAPGEYMTIRPANWTAKGAWRESVLVESTWPRVIESKTLQDYLAPDGMGVLIFRRKGLSMADRLRVVEAAREHLGERYGLFGLYWQLVRSVAAKAVGYPIYWIGRLFGKRWRGPQFRHLAAHNLTKPVYCSQLAALAFESIGVMITDEGGKGATPDGTDDFMCRNPDQFEVIYP